MADSDTADTILQSTVERALEPFRELMPPDALQLLREELLADLAQHPETMDLVRRLQRIEDALDAKPPAERARARLWRTKR